MFNNKYTNFLYIDQIMLELLIKLIVQGFDSVDVSICMYNALKGGV